jgi:hypothetical protein
VAGVLKASKRGGTFRPGEVLTRADRRARLQILRRVAIIDRWLSRMYWTLRPEPIGLLNALVGSPNKEDTGEIRDNRVAADSRSWL